MQIQYVFEMLGTAFFAISGALAANNRAKPDLFGVTFIGFITSIGGGSLRDVLLGAYPLAWIRDVHYLYAIFIGVLAARFFFTYFIKLRKSFFLFDTLGIALFSILGTEKALSLGINPLVAAIMGMFSAVMGGVIRDILTNEIPVIFQKEIYATACLIGGFIFVALDSLGTTRNLNFFISGSLIVIIRILAVKYQLQLPKFRPNQKGESEAN